jgi:hypothetical protein
MTAEANTDLRRQAVRGDNKKAGGLFGLRLRVFVSGFTVSCLAVFFVHRRSFVVLAFDLTIHDLRLFDLPVALTPVASGFK